MTDHDPAAMRRQYRTTLLDEADLAATPMAQFARWFKEAVTGGLHEPNAMVVATATPDGHPSTRTVLLKAYDDRGFVFYTNYASRKANELAANPHVSLLFPWHQISRQVIVTGRAGRIPQDETEAYFRTRPHGSQLGAWASPQSQPIASRTELTTRYEELATRYPEGTEVPLPLSGAASGSSRRRWSSGRATRTASTTACAMYRRPPTPGRWNAWPRSSRSLVLGPWPRACRNPRARVPPKRSRPDVPASPRVGDCWEFGRRQAGTAQRVRLAGASPQSPHASGVKSLPDHLLSALNDTLGKRAEPDNRINGVGSPGPTGRSPPAPPRSAPRRTRCPPRPRG